MGLTMNGLEHNQSVAWLRLWGAIGAQVVAEHLGGDHILGETARDFARFELRRWQNACHALETTIAAYAEAA